MKIYFLFAFFATYLAININEVFPDYTDTEYGVEKPYLFNASEFESHHRGRNLLEYPYYTETEKDC